MEKIRKTIIVFVFLPVTFCYSQITDFKHIDFTIADNTAELHKGKSIKQLRKFCLKLTSKLNTDVEKFRAIYTWVCNNIKTDVSMYYTVIRKHRKFKEDSLGFTTWSKSYNHKFIKNLLEKNKTICTGYAYLIKKMSNTVGIECELINGYGRTLNNNFDNFDFINHSWNAVKLNNKWYLCDATWSSGYLKDGSFINDYNDGFFLVDPELFSKNHFPKDIKWLLTKQEKNTFFDVPFVYTDNFKYKIIPISPKNMKVLVKRKEEIQFEFKSLKPIKTEDIYLISYANDNSHYNYPIYNISNVNSIIKFKHKFKHLGIYDIHLKVKNDIVISYSVKVE